MVACLPCPNSMILEFLDETKKSKILSLAKNNIAVIRAIATRELTQLEEAATLNNQALRRMLMNEKSDEAYAKDIETIEDAFEIMKQLHGKDDQTKKLAAIQKARQARYNTYWKDITAAATCVTTARMQMAKIRMTLTEIEALI
jgi:hypothetical protein